MRVVIELRAISIIAVVYAGAEVLVSSGPMPIEFFDEDRISRRYFPKLIAENNGTNIAEKNGTNGANYKERADHRFALFRFTGFLPEVFGSSGTGGLTGFPPCCSSRILRIPASRSPISRLIAVPFPSSMARSRPGRDCRLVARSNQPSLRRHAGR